MSDSDSNDTRNPARADTAESPSATAESTTKSPVAQANPAEPASSHESDETPVEHLEHRVLDPIKHRIYRPLNRLVDRLTYPRAAALLLVVVLGSWAIEHFSRNPEDAKRLITLTRFGFAARGSSPVADSSVLDVRRGLLNQLKDDVSPAKRKSGNEESYGPWTQAQMAVSLQGQDMVVPAELAQWFAGEMRDCPCWREYEKGPRNFAVTAWVLLSFARMGVKPDDRQIKFLLDHQKRAGWWPMFPAPEVASNASTYATAMSVWALNELLQRNLIASEQTSDVDKAIANGRGWLLDNSTPGKPGRWKDYPGPTGLYHEESLGISGLALHVLHNTKGAPPVANDLYWMANLPDSLPAPGDNSSSNHIVTTLEGPMADPTHNFSLPWLLIGTVDAYSHGTWSQRAHALRLFQQISGRQEAIARETTGKPWLAAEILISLRHLLHEDVI